MRIVARLFANLVPSPPIVVRTDACRARNVMKLEDALIGRTNFVSCVKKVQANAVSAIRSTAEEIHASEKEIVVAPTTTRTVWMQRYGSLQWLQQPFLQEPQSIGRLPSMQYLSLS